MDIRWRGKPALESFLGYYLTYSMPLIALIVSYALVYTMPTSVKNLFLSSAKMITAPGLTDTDKLVLLFDLMILISIGVIIGVLRISFTALLYYLIVFVVSNVLPFTGYWANGMIGIVLFTITITILALLIIDIYRRSFTYEITSKEIKICGGIISRVERGVIITRLEDIVIVKPLLGRIFGYGHLIPVTASRIGLGYTASLAGAGIVGAPFGAAVGGLKAIVDFKPRPYNSLYGIEYPENVKKLILGLATKPEEYMRRTAEGIERLEKRLGGEKV